MTTSTFTLAALGLALIAAPGSARADCQFPSLSEIPACIKASHASVGDRIAGHLAAYAKDPSGGCANDELVLAEAGARGYEQGVLAAAPDFDEGLTAGGFLLDVADAAQAHGCPSWATTTYRGIVARYVGTGYAALRERALLGLTVPVAPAPTAAPPAKRKARS